MGKRKLWERLLIITVIVTLFVPVLAACTKKEPQQQSDNTPRTLRFASGNGYIGDNGEVFRQYTELFEFKYDNIELEYIETMDRGRYGGYSIYLPPDGDEEEQDPLDALKEAMTGPTPPDIVMISYDQLAELINENLLVSLDELILGEPDFNADDFVPAVIDGLRKPGNGTLYALAPLFYSSAVIYNKNIFLDRAVEFPTDGMTWQEMFDLARRVTVKDEKKPIHGFSFNYWYGGGLWDLFQNMNYYTAPLGLKWVDEETLQMTTNTPAWQTVWKTFVDLYNEGVFPGEPDYSVPREGPVAWDIFLSGEAAMVVVPYQYLTDVIFANNNADRIENFTPFEWDVVTIPTHPEAPGVGSSVGYEAIFAINANAENLDDAWEFIKFVTGEEWARIKSKSVYNLVSRKSFIEHKDGADYNLDAFLTLTPPEFSQSEMRLWEILPDYWQLQSIGQRKLAEVINNGKDIELALQEWETEGQMMIQQMLENKENGGGSDGGGIIRPLPIELPVMIEDSVIIDYVETFDSTDE